MCIRDRDTHNAAKEVINQGLLKLGIIKSLDQKHTYFPHGTSHHIGLDVHDLNNRGPYQANMVITVEPGIYIPEEGIGIRLENNFYIGEEGNIDLMKNIPLDPDEIEELMAQ